MGGGNSPLFMFDVLKCQTGDYILFNMAPLKVEQVTLLPYKQLEFDVIHTKSPWEIYVPPTNGLIIYGYLSYMPNKLRIKSKMAKWNMRQSSWELTFLIYYEKNYNIDLPFDLAINTIKLEAL